jgi:hypothetical protein
MTQHRLHRLGCAFVVALVAAVSACGDTSSDRSAPLSLSAETASFDLAAGVDQRYLLGLFSDTGGAIVDGTAELEFTYLDGDTPDDPALRGVSADFLPVSGADGRPIADDAHIAGPGDGTGAYQARNVRFDKPGNWQVRATVQIDGTTVTVDEAFEVQAEQLVPAAGDQAPRSLNRTVEDPGAERTSIDSRANNGILPDPELHHQTVADAVASGRPTMIVVSTPTYCVSRFCGPITDTVQQLVVKYPDVNFVHLEVWENYENQTLNRAAAEWIASGGDGAEPWVFLVSGGGTVVERWDNVTNWTQLSAALDQIA